MFTSHRVIIPKELISTNTSVVTLSSEHCRTDVHVHVYNTQQHPHVE